MKIQISFLLFACLIISACANKTKVPEETPLTEAEVVAIISKFDEGWKNKKKATVDSVLSENYLYFTQSGHTFNRPSLVETAGSDVYTLQNMERESQTVLLEGNTAVVNTIWKGKGMYHGEAFNDKQRCSLTIVKHNGKVKILSEHCTPIK